MFSKFSKHFQNVQITTELLKDNYQKNGFREKKFRKLEKMIKLTQEEGKWLTENTSVGWGQRTG